MARTDRQNAHNILVEEYLQQQLARTERAWRDGSDAVMRRREELEALEITYRHKAQAHVNAQQMLAAWRRSHDIDEIYHAPLQVGIFDQICIGLESRIHPI